MSLVHLLDFPPPEKLLLLGKQYFWHQQIVAICTQTTGTHSDASSGLQSELVGKLVGDGAAVTYLPLHLPVAQRLIL